MRPDTSGNLYIILGFGIVVLLLGALSVRRPSGTGLPDRIDVAAISMQGQLAWVLGAAVCATLWMYGWIALGTGKI
jgi:hypothetical protein